MAGSYEENRFFVGDFDDALETGIVIPLAQEIEKQSKIREGGRIDLYINSVGGYVHLMNHLVELVEAAKREGVVVRTIVPDMAFSAGSGLAITGTPGERYIGRRAEHLIHYGQIMSFETTPEQIKRFTAWKERKLRANLEHYNKYSNVPNLEKHILDDGFFVKASDCIRWGLADKYMDKFTV